MLERCRRKEERSKQGHTNKATQHTQGSCAFLKKDELPQVGCTCNERCRSKEERSKQGHINNKAKQHNTPKAVTFLELPRVAFEPVHLNLYLQQVRTHGHLSTCDVCPKLLTDPPEWKITNLQKSITNCI